MAQADFPTVFESLKALYVPYKDALSIVHDREDNFYLNCPNDPFQKGKPHYFGSVNIRKNYVSFYLMPVYTHPDLLKGISKSLDKQRQGKSCFNFKKVDEELFAELKALVEKGFETYQEVGYINQNI